MTFRTAFALALTLSFLTACGGEDAAPSPDTAAADMPAAPAASPAPASAPAPPASGECPVSAAEASEILGVTVTQTGPSAGSCYITSEPLTFSGQMSVIPNYTVDAVVTNIAGASATQEPIAGLGERAAWVSTSTWEGRDLGGLVAVEQGGQGVNIILSARADVVEPDVRAKAEALARAAVDAM